MEYLMNKHIYFSSIRSLLTFWFVIMSLVPLVLITVMGYRHIMQFRKAEIFDKLGAIRDIKVEEVNNWLDEKIGGIRNLADDDEVRRLEKLLNGSLKASWQGTGIIKEARLHFYRLLDNFDDLDEIFLIDPASGKILVSTDTTEETDDRSGSSYFKGAMNAGDLFVGDIYYSKAQNRPVMAISIPVFSLEDRRDIIGILVAVINLERSLYAMLLSHTGLGDTWETVVVNKSLLALNKLRWYENAPLNLVMDSEAARKASEGLSGIIRTNDYRGKLTLAAYTYIPRTNWGFIIKQDIEEVYAPINKLRTWTLFIGVITVFGVVLAASRVSRSISGPIQALSTGSEIIGRGDLEHKVGIDSKDEVGRLSRIMDRMTDNLKIVTASRDELNREITERKKLEKMVLDIEELERRRIGNDLHDNIGQQLIGVSYKSGYLENSLKEKMLPEAETAGRIKLLIDGVKEELRILSRGLSPMMENNEISLMTAMEELASDSESIFNVKCVFKYEEIVVVDDESVVMHLYRIAQEAITNAVKHAMPGHIEICLGRKDERIVLTIKDDGRGFADGVERTPGMGLKTMRYRADMINATLDIRPGINGGTIVECVFPGTGEYLA